VGKLVWICSLAGECRYLLKPFFELHGPAERNNLFYINTNSEFINAVNKWISLLRDPSSLNYPFTVILNNYLIVTDASSEYGLGGIILFPDDSVKWFAVDPSENHREWSRLLALRQCQDCSRSGKTSFLETAAIIGALLLLTTDWDDNDFLPALVKVLSDNTSAVAAIRNWGSKGAPDLDRLIKLAPSDLSGRVMAKHIPGSSNVFADALSRGWRPDNSREGWERLSFPRLG
jgi:hypothetical protein